MPLSMTVHCTAPGVSAGINDFWVTGKSLQNSQLQQMYHSGGDTRRGFVCVKVWVSMFAPLHFPRNPKPLY